MIAGPVWGMRGDDDAGMHALETDVMRFMAILAFCLLAVFALVQSVPWSPEREVRPVPAAAAEIAELESEPDARVGTAVHVPDAAPAIVSGPVAAPRVSRASPAVAGAAPSKPVPRALTPAPQMQKETIAARPMAEPPPAVEVGDGSAGFAAAAPDDPIEDAATSAVVESAPTVEPDQVLSAQPATLDEAEQPDGFTLQFESDVAMFSLVESGAITLYALGEGSAWRLATRGGRHSFHAAAPPPQIYEMTQTTVPAALLRALRRRASLAASSVTWGVVLPAATRADIERVISESRGGRLLIQPDARVRLE